MRCFFILAGLAGVILVSVALAGDEAAAPAPDVKALAAKVEALTKQVSELKDQVDELKLQVAVAGARPVTTPAPPSGIPRNASPREINGSTYYIIPVGAQPPASRQK
jgi:hypothetical protein